MKNKCFRNYNSYFLLQQQQESQQNLNKQEQKSSLPKRPLAAEKGKEKWWP